MIQMTAAERLIVAADFKPDKGQGLPWARAQVLTLAQKLKGTGVYLKVNTALRACGYGLIREIHDSGLRVFADLKLYDISETLATDGALLQALKPEIVTVSCNAGDKAMRALKAALPETQVVGITVLTSLTSQEVADLYNGRAAETAVVDLAHVALQAGVLSIVCSPAEVGILRRNYGDSFTINTPGIRPAWTIVTGDDQNPDRVMTPSQAIKTGADRIVVGRPIVKSDDPLEATLRTIAEIESAIA